MEQSQSGKCGYQFARAVVILVLTVMYGGVGLYFRLVPRTDIVYTHFAYIPIVLAVRWWGRKGIAVAGVLAAMTLALHLLDTEGRAVWPDVARAMLFLVVSLAVGSVCEKAIQAQKALRTSEEKHRHLIEQSLSGTLVYRDNTILFTNSRFAEMLGYSIGDMPGRPVLHIIHPDDRPRVSDIFLRRQAGELWDLQHECRLLGRDGSTVWGGVASRVADYEGGPAVLVNVYDITEQKETEEKHRELSEIARQQEEQLVHSNRLAELGEMAAMIAHELNQPLTGIRNFAANALYMIDEDAGSLDDVKDNLRLISEQVDRATRTIDQMRELTRRSDRRLVLVDVNTAVREVTEFLMPQFRLSSVEVVMELQEGLPPVTGDRIRLEQVFLNLLTNARQAMEDVHTRRLCVRTRAENRDTESVVVEIEDTGRGFSSAEKARLFEPFYTTKKPGEGTGLGLSISMSIAKEHGARIEVEGAPGRGARFTLSLPFRAGGA